MHDNHLVVGSIVKHGVVLPAQPNVVACKGPSSAVYSTHSTEVPTSSRLA